MGDNRLMAFECKMCLVLSGEKPDDESGQSC